jgi:2-polyprenyl-6-methoxyphenol hydroxylase-like FAD-dependent oxidoreductase
MSSSQEQGWADSLPLRAYNAAVCGCSCWNATAVSPAGRRATASISILRAMQHLAHACRSRISSSIATPHTARWDASVDIFDTGLKPLLHRMGDVAETGPTPAAVDRGTLRAILLDAAEDVRFGCEVVDVNSLQHGVEVHLSDGSTASANLLVAADGAKSTLRRRLLPGHEPAPLATIGIYGRAPFDTSSITWLPRGVVDQRFVGVTDGSGTTLALGAWHPRRVPSEAAKARVPGFILPATVPYVMWVLLCPAEVAPSLASGPETLHQFALSAISGWSPAATRFVREAIVPDTFRVTLRAMGSVPSWSSSRITFLGDAIHAMSPAGGEGANTAMADGTV